jgi:hypothetical protein
MVDACAIFELPTKVIMPDGLVVTDMAELPWFVAPAARPLGGTHG